MKSPRIALVGAGNLACALAMSLHHAGFPIEAIIARTSGESLRKARLLACKIGVQALDAAIIANTVILRRRSLAPKDPSNQPGLSNPQASARNPRTSQRSADLSADIIWFCVPDSQIAAAAASLADAINWKGRVALHSSGALSSDTLDSLRRRGAAVASVHPLMTFVKNSRPSMNGVPFAIEGDTAALRIVRRIVRKLGGQFFPIRKADKPAYHAWGTFASPLLTALLATTERVAALAGVDPKAAAKRMLPILRQTLENYAEFGAPQAFSGPIVRGDAETVRKHLDVLRAAPAEREVYIALVRASLKYLPVKYKERLTQLLDSSRREA